jgi:uncharacterized protein
MILGKFTNIIKIERDKNKYVLLNALSGAVDIASKEEIAMINDFKENGKPLPFSLMSQLAARRYLFVNTKEEERYIKEKYDEFLSLRDQVDIQFLLSMTYSCNFDCSYCYQKNFDKKYDYISKEKIDDFFIFASEVTKTRKNKNYYITLFGGEPFLKTKDARDALSYLVSLAKQKGIKLSAVTNGYHVEDYIDLITPDVFFEVQVTLDGYSDVHDKRRPLHGNKGTFDKIIKGMTLLKDKGIPINLRIVVDKTNIKSIVSLAEYLDTLGFYSLDKSLFKTQLGRSYNLFSDLDNKNTLSYLEMHEEFVELSREHPQIKKLYQPGFKGIKHLVQTGRLPYPLFDSCPAYKSEWAFDASGNVYGCTASCGDEKYKSGSAVSGRVDIDASLLEEWQKRDVLNIDKCTSCSYALFCGGGCGVMSKEHSGGVLAPDCKDIEGIISLGVNYYFDEISNIKPTDTCCII